MRNLPDRARAPGTQQLVRQPSLAQTIYPGISGCHPHFATFPPFELAGSCVRNANAHTWGGAQLRLQCSRPLLKGEDISGLQVAAASNASAHRKGCPLLMMTPQVNDISPCLMSLDAPVWPLSIQ